MSAPANPDRRALKEAAAWHTRLRDLAATDDDQRAWAHWHMADPAHAQAWNKVLAVGAQLGRIPAPLALRALDAPPRRRDVLRALAPFAATGIAGWASWQAVPWRELQATHRTRTGERRQLALPDGSSLAMDTHTALDEAFDPEGRRLRLHVGRIFVSTRPDPYGRPFSVETRQGRVLALGTRFSVQAGDAFTRVAVHEKAVRVHPLAGMPRELRQGEQASYSAQAVGATAPLASFADGWTRGSLAVVDMPLGELVDELSRYRPGHLACSPAAAGLLVSGVFPLDDTDRALTALAHSFPLTVTYRTRFWVEVALT